MCESCGWQANCPHCDAHFTLHSQPYHYLHCHHCGTINRLLDHCPTRQKQSLVIGAGTAKLWRTCTGACSSHHEVIWSIVTAIKWVGSWQKIYDRIQQNKPSIFSWWRCKCAYYHHFPHVTPVAILDIDAGLLQCWPTCTWTNCTADCASRLPKLVVVSIKRCLFAKFASRSSDADHIDWNMIIVLSPNKCWLIAKLPCYHLIALCSIGPGWI